MEVRMINTSYSKETINELMMFVLKVVSLFFLTAFAEILGCYLLYLWLKENKSAWLLLPAGISLAVFAWLLTWQPFILVYGAYIIRQSRNNASSETGEAATYDLLFDST